MDAGETDNVSRLFGDTESRESPTLDNDKLFGLDAATLGIGQE